MVVGLVVCRGVNKVFIQGHVLVCDVLRRDSRAWMHIAFMKL